MHTEIERKFLVEGDFQPHVTESERIVQGYLSSVPERNVRVRIKGGKGFITVKGIGNQSGTSRFEWEKEIALEEAEKLLAICEPGVIEKTRYIVPEKSGLNFEVDVFEGENQGLVVAEIELPDESHTFHRPDWLGQEVTGQVKYYNSSLKKNPYSQWDQ
ncbi:MAG: CYTH domain-containing protein [bacterium]|jgi:adenylate cyclase